MEKIDTILIVCVIVVLLFIFIVKYITDNVLSYKMLKLELEYKTKINGYENE